jgi:hypothetical protein
MAEDGTPRDERIDEDNGGLSRGKVLGVGAAALGALAIGELSRPGRAAAATSASPTTKLVAAIAAGDTHLKVSSVAGFAAGSTIWIDIGFPTESAVVSNVGSAGLSGSGITLSTGVARAHPKGTAVAVTPSVSSVPGQFADVLKRVVTDSSYSAATLQNPQKILTDYPHLSILELEELRNVGILSGWDVSVVNRVRAQSMGDHAADSGTVNQPGGGALGFAWSCCCSCCCTVPIRGFS